MIRYNDVSWFVYVYILYRIELGAEMKKNMKEKESEIRILLSEKSSMKDRLQKLEVRLNKIFIIKLVILLTRLISFRSSLYSDMMRRI